MAKKATIEAVEIAYDLFDLPTAQHKAGLAGLILTIRSLHERSKKDPEAIPPQSVPEIAVEPTATEVTVRFTRDSFARLINDLYDADPTKTAQEKPRKNKKTKETIPWLERGPVEVKDKKTGETTTKEGYVYLDAVPRFNPVRAALQEQANWLKLWTDFMKSVVRDSKKWAPYRVRAAAKSAEAAKCLAWADEESDSTTAAKKEKAKGDGSTWLDMVAYQQERLKGKFRLGSISSALLLGAQDRNAESVDFKGRVEHNLLLHFWPLCVLISVPWLIDREGKSKEVGYVAAIPEVASLARFCDKFPHVLDQMARGTKLRGKFRPVQSVIDMPAQGALEFLRYIAQFKVAEQEANPMRAVNSIEFLHLDKQGNNVKVLTSGRVPANEDLLDGYRDIVERGGYWNPLFKSALILAHLRDKPWWGEMLPLIMNRDAGFFVPVEKTKPEIARLRQSWTDDARKRLTLDEEKHQNRRRSHMQSSKGDSPSPPTGEPPPLTGLINRLVRNYVNARAQERAGIDLDKFKEGEGKNRRVTWDRVPADFGKERAKVAQSLFLEFRSRRDQAFVAHFAQTFFAVPQYMSETDGDQEQIAQVMIFDRRFDDIKTLTLMALSAAAWSPQRPNEKGTEE